MFTLYSDYAYANCNGQLHIFKCLHKNINNHESGLKLFGLLINSSYST